MVFFDIKMDYTHKAQQVARGDQTETRSTLTYSSVVSRERVCLSHSSLIAALNDLDSMQMFDIGNAYLNSFSCLADADVWRRDVAKPNGELYYEYLLIYADDRLVISINPDTIIEHLQIVLL